MKNKIKISDDVRIDLSDGNYVVKYRQKNSTKRAKHEYRWEVGGYFTCLEDAVLDILDNNPLKKDYLGISLLEMVELLEKMIKQIIRNIKKYGTKI